MSLEDFILYKEGSTIVHIGIPSAESRSDDRQLRTIFDREKGMPGVILMPLPGFCYLWLENKQAREEILH